jgi:two-component system, chemotaxis family, protein-glutamate methylesterase/glutaminase
MANRDVVAIGTSAGGVEALLILANDLSQNFPASILVTVHPPLQFRSSLDDMLTRRAVACRVRQPRRGHKEGSHMHCPIGAAPDYRWERLSLGTGPREENARTAIDAMLFRCGLPAATGR